MTTNIIDDIIFEKYNEGKLSEDKMLLLLEASNTNKEEIKRIKEKIKKKEKLSEAEKKKYEMYKKSRNKKIAIGVGIGAAGIAAAGIAVNHRLKEEDKALQEQIKRSHEHDEQERKKREKERLELKEQERKKRDENERIRNDNADLINQLQKEIRMYTRDLFANKELLRKIENQLDETDKEINNMRNKMGPNESVNSVYKDTIAGLERSKERIYKAYSETKKAIEKCETEIWRRNNKLDKINP